MPDLLIRYSKLHGCHTAPLQTGEGARVHGPTEVRRHGFHAFFFLTLYISTPMLLSADNAITCNLRKSSPALFRNNQKILLLISFCKNLYKLKVLL